MNVQTLLHNHATARIYCGPLLLLLLLLCVIISIIHSVLYHAERFNQDPFCGPSWVDSTAYKSQIFYGVKKGSIANTACCTVGTYWIQGTSKCTRCTIGKYNNELGLIACKDCASGKYNNELGLIACKDCASGKYNNETGSSAIPTLLYLWS